MLRAMTSPAPPLRVAVAGFGLGLGRKVVVLALRATASTMITALGTLTPTKRWQRQPWRQGGTIPAVLNAANEQAVALFLEERIHFLVFPASLSGPATSNGGIGTARRIWT